jgi:hypothetical protein
MSYLQRRDSARTTVTRRPTAGRRDRGAATDQSRQPRVTVRQDRADSRSTSVRGLRVPAAVRAERVAAAEARGSDRRANQAQRGERRVARTNRSEPEQARGERRATRKAAQEETSGGQSARHSNTGDSARTTRSVNGSSRWRR